MSEDLKQNIAPQAQNAPLVQEPEIVAPQAAKAPGGVRHLAMVICILLGVFIYAGWRIKSQQPGTGAEANQPTAGVVGVLKTMYENLRHGLAGKVEEPANASADTPAQVQEAYSPSPVTTAVTPVAPVAQVAPQPVQPMPAHVPALVREPAGAGTGIARNESLGTGLDGLSLPGDPAAGSMSVTSGARPELAHVPGGQGGTTVSVSGGQTHQPVIPGAVATPTGSQKLKSVYDKVKALETASVPASGSAAYQDKSKPVTATHKPVTTIAMTSGSVDGGHLSALAEEAAGKPVRETKPVVTTPATTGEKTAQKADKQTGKSAEKGTEKAEKPAAKLAEKTTAEKVAEKPADKVRSADKSSDEDDFVYTVQGTDTLASIAEKYLGARTRAKEVFEANRDQLARPDQMRVGMRLRIPGAVRGESPLVHVVSASDSLPSLAVRYYGSATQEGIAEIRKANPALQHGGFKPGLRLVIPSKSAVAVKAPERVAEKVEPKKASIISYTVRPGDNLRKIAEVVYSDPDRWRDIYDANRKQLPSANMLYTGLTLTIPQ